MKLIVEFQGGDGYVMFEDVQGIPETVEVNFQLPVDRKRMFVDRLELEKFLEAAHVFLFKQT